MLGFPDQGGFSAAFIRPQHLERSLLSPGIQTTSEDPGLRGQSSFPSGPGKERYGSQVESRGGRGGLSQLGLLSLMASRDVGRPGI